MLKNIFGKKSTGVVYIVCAALLFCVIGGITVHSRSGEGFRIRSFKDGKAAVTDGSASFRTVAANVNGDETDYKKLARRLKLQFYGVRIAYIALYGLYVLQTGLSAHEDGLQWATLCLHLTGLALTAALYIYEFRLFRRGERDQRLRKLKIAKAAVRVYSIALSLASVFAADTAFNDLTVVTSVGMAVFNLCSLFYNLFGSPRRYPAAAGAAVSEPPLLPIDEPHEQAADAAEGTPAGSDNAKAVGNAEAADNAANGQDALLGEPNTDDGQDGADGRRP